MANLNQLKLVFALVFLFALIDFSYLYPTHSQHELSLGRENEESNGVDIYNGLSENERTLAEVLMNNPKVLGELLAAEYQERQPSSDANSNHLSRDRRRISVFKNIYNQCRIQKRKEKNFCLYLANLYQNVKGFHGL